MKLTLLQKFIVAIVWIAVSSNNIIFCVQGFIIPHPHSHSHSHPHPQQHQYPTISSYESTTILYAQKKRRRRKDSSSSNDEASSSFINNNNDMTNNEEENDEDELPDFDLVEDIDLPLQSSTSSPSSSTSTSNSSTKKKTIMNPDDPSVIAAMKATSTNPLSTSTSTKDLLKSRNRELEQKFVVDEISQDLPSFADYNSKKGRDGSSANNSGMGKKAMRREQRKAAALEAQGNIGSEEEDGNPLSQLLSKLPFGGNGGAEEKENKSIIKLLEEGTWACIYILVAWEIYINTPLFQRAAPLAPVVFRDPVTTTFLL